MKTEDFSFLSFSSLPLYLVLFKEVWVGLAHESFERLCGGAWDAVPELRLASVKIVNRVEIVVFVVPAEGRKQLYDFFFMC